jgi:hypothetical protein
MAKHSQILPAFVLCAACDRDAALQALSAIPTAQRREVKGKRRRMGRAQRYPSPDSRLDGFRKPLTHDIEGSAVNNLAIRARLGYLTFVLPDEAACPPSRN